MATNHRQNCTKFTEDQLKILIKAFSQKPYPGYTIKQKLVLEITTEESRIYVWFQNGRVSHRVWKSSEPEEYLEARRDQDHPEERNQSGEDASVMPTSSRSHILITARRKNPYTDIDSRIKSPNLVLKSKI
ncbi:Double homeobox protein A [Myotis brandtii]|uniref:Double homeobox protein A n=1 Tax=Myotis brandtii TaxID=109478 RepID=S7P2L8_MYOBR|nr:Double homeobox protein A [Myotis brandtii]